MSTLLSSLRLSVWINQYPSGSNNGHALIGSFALASHIHLERYYTVCCSGICWRCGGEGLSLWAWPYSFDNMWGKHVANCCLCGYKYFTTATKLYWKWLLCAESKCCSQRKRSFYCSTHKNACIGQKLFHLIICLITSGARMSALTTPSPASLKTSNTPFGVQRSQIR